MTKPINQLTRFLTAVGILMVSACMVALLLTVTRDGEQGSHESVPYPAVPAGPTLGEQGHMRVAAVLAVDDAAWDAMTDAQVVGDTIGLTTLLLNGRVFILEAGTPVLVIDIGFTSLRVRALDGPSAGLAGWVQIELVGKVEV